jgi:DNA-binding GntR family transcriptional regulator
MNETKPLLNLGGDPIYTRVYNKLREEILGGIFAAGERLNIGHLSQRYSVSRMPVREAVQALQGEGLIVLEPYAGPRVRTIDQRFLENMYDLRCVVDGLLMRTIARAISRELLAEATALNAAYTAAVQQEEWPRAFAANKQFHRVLQNAADNPEAMDILERRWDLIECLRMKYKANAERLAEAGEEHKLLLEALAAHDADAAERVARLHGERAKEELLKKWGQE